VEADVLTRLNGPARTSPPYDEILTLAMRAPSIYNTQPWWWRVGEHGVDLLQDHSRRLVHADPDDRNLVLSCGAALHHLQVAAAGLGWDTVVRRVPDPAEPRTLASIVLRESPSTSLTAARRLHTLTVRQTDRRRFTKTPVPTGLLARLAHTGARWGAQVLPITQTPLITELLRANARADAVQRSDPGYQLELAAWTRFRRGEGVRPEAVPGTRPPTDPASSNQRFPDGLLEDAVLTNDQSSAGTLLLVSSSSDDTLSRLRAGEAMSEVWLDATEAGLSVVPLSQCIEVTETRQQIIRSLLDDRTFPQILLQVGHQPSGLKPLPRSPRRPVCDVIVRR
jgi:hypothetical protein